MKKTLTLIVAFTLVLALGIGGTLAWLTFQTPSITNTFTLGDLEAELYETDENGEKTTVGLDYTAVSPGDSLDKDPTIEIDKEGWVFIGVSNPNNGMITFTLNSGWTALGETKLVDGVTYDIYAKTDKAAAETPYALFSTVTISENAVNGDDGTDFEDITVIGFAVQADAGATAQAAWDATFGA